MNEMRTVGHINMEPHPTPDQTLHEALAKHTRVHGYPADIAFVNPDDLKEISPVAGVLVCSRPYVPRNVVFCGVLGVARR